MTNGYGRAVTSVAARPWLWATGLRQLFVLAPRGWWRRKPFLPLPDEHYLAFRMQTMYGDPDHQPEPADLVSYLHWCREFRQLTR